MKRAIVTIRSFEAAKDDWVEKISVALVEIFHSAEVLRIQLYKEGYVTPQVALSQDKLSEISVSTVLISKGHGKLTSSLPWYTLEQGHAVDQ